MNREARGTLPFALVVFLASLPLLGTGTPVLAGVYNEAVLSSNPTAYWRFDDASSSNGATAADATGTHDGTYQGGATPVVLSGDTPGAIGGTSVDLDGVDDYVATTTLGSFGSSMMTGTTQEFWIETTTTASGRALGTFNNGSNTTVVLALNTDRSSSAAVGKTELFTRRQGGGDGTAEFDQSVVNLYDGNWHHVAWRFSNVPGDRMDLFVDGRQVPLTFGSVSFGTYANFDHAYLIGDANNRGTPFGSNVEARMDEFAVYEHVLAPSQIRDHYSAAFGGERGAIVEHVADLDPTTENPAWGTDIRGTSHVLTPGIDASTGERYWEIANGGDRVEYRYTPAPDVVADADAAGWRLVSRLQILEGHADLDVVSGYVDGDKQVFLQNWGRTGGDSGELVYGFLNGPSVTLDAGRFDPDAYHTYELLYDPDTATVDALVDGTLIAGLSGYGGYTDSGTATRVFFGAFRNSSDVRWSLVQFERLPEPAAAVLLGAGALLLMPMARRRRRRRPWT